MVWQLSRCVIKGCCTHRHTLSKELRVRKTRRWISREEETVITGMDCYPVAAEWRYYCVAEGTIFDAHPDCSVVISVSKTNVHGCPKKEVL